MSKKDKDLEKPLDVSVHMFVPKHELVPKDEVDTLLSKYNTTLQQLPYIFNSDPAVVNLEANPGDVIKITRPSQTAGETFYYRYVVEA
tara:strand:- start:158 stop:421 length:264 start_codon:yes stop_codon:yes gene_type:complete